MIDWTPPTHEPPADEAAITDFIRMSAGIFQNPKAPQLYRLGPAAVQTAEGLRMAIDLQLSPSDETRLRGRECAIFTLGGHAATDQSRYRVRGRVAVDLETLAFMAIEAELIRS